MVGGFLLEHLGIPIENRLMNIEDRFRFILRIQWKDGKKIVFGFL
jgi:hypothetical protein